MYPIDTTIPVPTPPEKKHRTGREAKYPIAHLQPGESFYVPITDPQKSRNLRGAMSIRAKKLNFKIVSLADQTGIRIWRTM